MSLSTEQCLSALTHHSEGLAAAARGHLDARVEHCPDWSVGDLVWHVVNVHWMWGTIVEERLASPPDEARRPPRPADDELLETFLIGAGRLVRVLGETDQSAACWTWAPQQADVAFVTRHQVQEAAVHHWDAVNAVAPPPARGLVAEDVARDAVEEFLTFSVSSEADPAEPGRSPLDGALWLQPTPGGELPTLLVEDGATPGTTTWRRVPAGTSTTELATLADRPVRAGGQASAERFLLWLYGRASRPWDADGSAVASDEAILDRLRALTFTD